MKLTFTWENKFGTNSPCCSSDVLNDDGISILSCLLMDDGGAPYLESIPWIREGITKIDLVLSGQVESINWDREAWGVLINRKEAKIYSVAVDSYMEKIAPEQLRVALMSWESFLHSKPRADEKYMLELQD